MPARIVRTAQRCRFCWREIRPAEPGSTRGTRGAKAYFFPETGTWECVACREERTRADLAGGAA